jgi:hypothetical protein
MDQERETAELLPLNSIRTETVLSRFPIHRLAKRGTINIEIKELTGTGELRTTWEVDYPKKLGQPGPLAYKVDTLIINRRIEESPRPVPTVIKLGSLSEVCRELGMPPSGKNTNDVKKALRQNAGAFITAKRAYKGADGGERTAEISDTRYGVVFTGEKFPDGRRADGVYVLLHDAYREILNTAQTRPLDYDYLLELSPGAQRLYELLSYQMFAALRNGRPRAKMLYSYYCVRAPQTRYDDYDHVKKQMYKLHAPHRKSNYIGAVEFRETRDREGQPDWEMLYTPGRRAKAEFRAFTQPKKTLAVRPERAPQLTESAPPQEEVIFPAAEDPLVEQLLAFGVERLKAKELIEKHREAAEAQIAAYPYRGDGKPKKNAAGWLIAAIEGNYTLPITYLEEQEKKRRAATAKEQKSAIDSCRLCDQKGWRRIRTPEYPNGAMKRCSHDPEAEAKHKDV